MGIKERWYNNKGRLIVTKSRKELKGIIRKSISRIFNESQFPDEHIFISGLFWQVWPYGYPILMKNAHKDFEFHQTLFNLNPIWQHIFRMSQNKGEISFILKKRKEWKCHSCRWLPIKLLLVFPVRWYSFTFQIILPRLIKNKIG